MGDYHVVYPGADYGTDPEYPPVEGYNITSSNIVSVADARTANQLKSVSQRLNSGGKTVEISILSPQVFEAIPKQHFKEIERLRKLVGAEITLHAPVFEPTGISKEGGWNESERVQTERQMFNIMQQGQKLDPNGNLVITFHTSALPEMETKTFDEKKGEEIHEIMAIDERTGSMGKIQTKSHIHELEREEGKKISTEEILKDRNTNIWTDSLKSLNFEVNRGTEMVEAALSPFEEEKPENAKEFLKKYKEYTEGKSTAEIVKELPEKYKISEKHFEKQFRELGFGQIYLRNAYNEFKELFDRAYYSASDVEKEKLQQYKKEVLPKIKQKYYDDPARINEFAKDIEKGLHILSPMRPQTFKPMRDFALDKGSETFSNLAIKSFEDFGENSPIISIENPPVGMGLSRGQDVKDIVEKSREKFVDKAVEKFHISRDQAKKEAEKLIGATWDVGHINMLRKYGYGEKHLLEEAKKVGPLLKHIHLSDNFGLEHTELPMGMGNVPMEKTMKALGDAAKKVKKTIEAGSWYEPFGTTPLKETMAHFNSPIYAMKNAPAWSNYMGAMGGYYTGQVMNPDIHQSIYGAGFTALPPELGGGTGRSRISGTPIE